MVKHIILWNLKDDIEDKQAVIKGMKEGLEGLMGVVPSIREIHVYDKPLTTSSVDASLEVIVDDEKGLSEYTNHPAHQKVANECIRPFVKVRSCIDYEY